MFIITNKVSEKRMGDKIFPTYEAAERWICRLGPILSENYVVTSIHQDIHIRKMLNEGLVKNDLEGILLPLISIDEYVAQEPDSSNVVIAFFIKGVPEAVHPLQNFLSYCNGVLIVDSGDSDTIQNTSIVYTEFSRDKLSLRNIHHMVHDVGMLANLSPDEFSVSFPNTDKKFPYNLEILKKYFKHRSEKINQAAQAQALQARVKELQQDLKDKMGDDKKQMDKEVSKNDIEGTVEPQKNASNVKDDLANTIGESRLIEKIVGLF